MIHIAGITWNCGCCHYRNFFDQLEKTYSYYLDHSADTCDGCRDKCRKDENCFGVQCNSPHPSSQFRQRFGVPQCLWWKIRWHHMCEYNNINEITCWKQEKSKRYALLI